MGSCQSLAQPVIPSAHMQAAARLHNMRQLYNRTPNVRHTHPAVGRASAEENRAASTAHTSQTRHGNAAGPTKA
jgi:hypothetical protein